VKIQKVSQAKKEGNLFAIIYGVPGVGKTTMVETLPKPLLIDLERGFAVLKKDVDVAICNTWKDVSDSIAAAVKDGYESVMIDSATRMFDLLTEEILKKKDLQALRIQDYGEISTKITRLVWDLKTKYKLNVILVAHASEDKDEDNGGAVFTKPLLSPKSLAEKLPAAADVLGYLSVAKDGTRKLFTQPTDKFKAKSRIKNLASPCKPDFSEILEAYKASINEMERDNNEDTTIIESNMAVESDAGQKAAYSQANGTSAQDVKLSPEIEEIKNLTGKYFNSPDGRKEYSEILKPFNVTSARELSVDDAKSVIEIIKKMKEVSNNG
jgi:phage nucleotide-binding protein